MYNKSSSKQKIGQYSITSHFIINIINYTCQFIVVHIKHDMFVKKTHEIDFFLITIDFIQHNSGQNTCCMEFLLCML